MKDLLILKCYVEVICSTRYSKAHYHIQFFFSLADRKVTIILSGNVNWCFFLVQILFSGFCKVYFN